MSFAHPHLLLLAFLVPPLLRLVRTPGRPGLTALRAVLLALAVLYLAGPRYDRTRPGVDVLVVADRSASMGDEAWRRQEEILALLGEARGPHDRIGVVAFGMEPVVEAEPAAGGAPGGFARTLDPNGSDLAAALRLARSRAEPTRRTRLLVLSDGRYTGRAPDDPRVLADLGDLPVWFRTLGRSRAGDVAAGAIDVPAEVTLGTGFVVRYDIVSTVATEAAYRLRRGKRTLAEGRVQLEPGVNRFAARDLADVEGMIEYRLSVDAAKDPAPENDVSSALTRVVSAPRVLVLSGAKEAEGFLTSALEQAGIPYDAGRPSGEPLSAALLDPYRVVVLENLPLDRLGPDGSRALADAVEHGVTALLVTGGAGSFGQGGYHKSPLDPLLPVSMELREEQRRNLMAVAIVMDRSGSMSMPAGGGQTKMDLANAAAAESIRLLSEMDQVSVIAVDSSEHVIVPLSQADATDRLIDAVLRVESMGGGIFVHTGLAAAARELRKSKAPTRHVLLFSDAGDSEEQSGCIPLARQLLAEKIGISVVGLGQPTDSDAQFLRDLAKAGDGAVHFTNRPDELPRLFSQEIIRVSRRGFVDEPVAVKPLPDLLQLGLPPGATPPPVGGYNLTSLREDASCALLTIDDYAAPVVAWRRRGRAVTGAVTAEIDGPYTGEWAAWERTPGLVVGLIRRLAGEVSTAQVKSYTRTLRGEARIRLEFEEATAAELRAGRLEAVFLPPEGAEPVRVPMEWEGRDSAVARLTLTRPGHYLPVVDLGDLGVVKAPPATLPHSPEFLADTAGRSGRETLERLARITGGDYLARMDRAFDVEGTNALVSAYDLRPWVAILIVLALLAEMAERRLGAIGLLRRAALVRRLTGRSDEGAA